MTKFSLWLVGFWLLFANAAYSAEAIGFRQVELGQGGARPLSVSLWYPVEGGVSTETVGENRAFVGVQVVRDGTPDTTTRPLVVLSHGYGGSWRNLNWLAGELVGQGYIVAAPDHPGTTVFNKDPAHASMLWERPRDLSRVIDAVMENPGWAGTVVPGRIAAVGHSLGGWAVIALAGARFDPARFVKHCLNNSSLWACWFQEELGLASPALGGAMGDSRVGAFVSLDLGLARGFSPESLAAITKPTLVIAAGIDIGGMPASLESHYITEHLPKDRVTSIEIVGAMHFSFMQLCKPGAATLLEEEKPGDGIVCKDGDNRTRDDIHRQVADLVINFLAKAIPTP